MKQIFFTFFIPLFVITAFMACSTETGQQEPTRLELLPANWSFGFTQPALSLLTVQSPQAELAAPDDIEKGFTVKLKVNLKPFTGEATLLEMPQVLTVRLRQHDPQDRRRQNYPAFRMTDGSVPVLEASITLLLPTEKHEIQDMTVGIPLAILEQPFGNHEVILHFSGTQWTMYVDGQLLDNDYALGYPQWKGKNTWSLNPAYITNAEIHAPAIEPERQPAQTSQTTSERQPAQTTQTASERQPAQTSEAAPEIQYWTPPGHNAWVGDVATLYHNGRYHVFYLYDRRHHASKFGRGAHYFEHISTADFKTWVEHKAATPLEEQWETIGTGTPFVFNGKLCVSYGLHTTRIYPREQTTLPEMRAYLEEHGQTGFFHRDNIKGVPAGSTYSVSADGLTNFVKTNTLFHHCENPSVYTDPEGKLKMLANAGARGAWESESVDGGWRCIDPDFPLGGDCTFFFRWGQFDYVIGGFVNFWSRPVADPAAKYTDVVKQGLDCYNGLNVPAVSQIPDGRFLMAGWMEMRGWGGPLVIHELIQFPDGRIGSKWMKEITPVTESPQLLAKKLSEPLLLPATNESYLLTFQVKPAKKSGKLGIVFLNENGEQNACEWQIRPDELTAQFASGSTTGFSEVKKSLREGGRPQSGNNYAIENLIGVERPFTVRIIVKGSQKYGGTVLDAEIAGQRTMLAYCPELYVKKMFFRSDGLEIENIKMAPLVHP